jgi:hypothetical protein
MNRVKIYKITRTKTFQADEKGVGFSLAPWGEDTDNYEGYDDGGQYYDLPSGYTIAESKSGDEQIYNASGEHCPLVMHVCGRPQIIDNKNCPVLTLSQNQGEEGSE